MHIINIIVIIKGIIIAFRAASKGSLASKVQYYSYVEILIMCR